MKRIATMIGDVAVVIVVAFCIAIGIGIYNDKVMARKNAIISPENRAADVADTSTSGTGTGSPGQSGGGGGGNH